MDFEAGNPAFMAIGEGKAFGRRSWFSETYDLHARGAAPPVTLKTSSMPFNEEFYCRYIFSRYNSHNFHKSLDNKLQDYYSYIKTFARSNTFFQRSWTKGYGLSSLDPIYYACNRAVFFLIGSCTGKHYCLLPACKRRGATQYPKGGESVPKTQKAAQVGHRHPARVAGNT